MNLTLVERSLLANQYRILEVLVPAEEETYRNARLALERGFEGDYDCVGIHRDEMSLADCEEVHRILRMFRTISGALKRLPDTRAAVMQQLQFQGFDGNEETNQYAYLYYYVNDLGRYDEHRGRELNSHQPVLDMYRRMLRAFESATSGENELTGSDLEKIAAAGERD